MPETSFSLTGRGMTLQKPADLKEPKESDDGYSLTELDSSDYKFKEIAVDFKDAGLKLLKLEQLDNHQLWQKYTAEKKAIETRKPQDPNFAMNEKYLYHGTTAKKEYICTEGLDARLSKKGRFGQGIYFSDNPLKCVKYAEKKENTHFIVLARIILGCSKVYPPGQKDRLLTREPEKTGKFKGWRFHDSVVGWPKDFKEYVIYRNDRAFIECIITYTKDSNNPSSSSISRAINLSSFSSAKVCYAKSSHTYEETDGDSDTSDGEEKAEFSDSANDDDDKSGTSESESNGNVNGVDGYSSDSSLEDRNRSQLPNHTKYNSVTNSANTLTPALQVQKGEDILADKKKQFTLQTGERRQHVIESFLSTTGLDVDRAVQLFKDKERKKGEMERKEMEMKHKQESSDEEDIVYEDAASAPVTPHRQPDKWKQLGSEDKDAIIDALTDDFLSVVGLNDNAGNRTLSRKILFTCDCDLDSAIVAYFESL